MCRYGYKSSICVSEDIYNEKRIHELELYYFRTICVPIILQKFGNHVGHLIVEFCEEVNDTGLIHSTVTYLEGNFKSK